MQKTFPLSKPLLVLSMLVLAALACYSDSPLWPYEITEPAPSPTFLPTPGPDSPAKFVPGDIVVAPRSQQVNPRPFLYVADYPEPVNQALSNRSGTCEFDRELQILYAGNLSDEQIYYLVACQGSVGWAAEENLAGPIQIQTRQNALTTAVDVNGNPITNGMFGIHNNQPPVIGPPLVQCQVNEVVDVRQIAIPNTGEVWYQIGCSGGIGWVEGSRLFGPLVLPANGGVGLVNPEAEKITLNTEPAGSDVAGECTGNSIIVTREVELVGNAVYYHLECGDVNGWAVQDNIYELTYLPDTLALVVVPQLDAPAEEEAAAAEEVTDETAEDEATEEVLAAPLTAEPGNPSDENATVGECPSVSIVHISEATVRNEVFYYNVECGEATGWLSEAYILRSADYRLDDTVAITADGFVGSGNNAAFYIADQPIRLAGDRGALGVCTPDTLVLIEDFTYVIQGGIPNMYYQITCQVLDSEDQLTGWVEQSRLSPASVLESDGATSTEIFGG